MRGLPFTVGEINKMWIINGVLIDQASSLPRLYGFALDINTLGQQNQYSQLLYEKPTESECVLIILSWIFYLMTPAGEKA